MNDRELKVRPGEVYFQEAMAGRYWYRFLSDREVEFGRPKEYGEETGVFVGTWIPDRENDSITIEIGGKTENMRLEMRDVFFKRDWSRTSPEKTKFLVLRRVNRRGDKEWKTFFQLEAPSAGRERDRSEGER
jgi:hypothetical protein